MRGCVYDTFRRRIEEGDVGVYRRVGRAAWLGEQTLSADDGVVGGVSFSPPPLSLLPELLLLCVVVFVLSNVVVLDVFSNVENI